MQRFKSQSLFPNFKELNASIKRVLSILEDAFNEFIKHLLSFKFTMSPYSLAEPTNPLCISLFVNNKYKAPLPLI